ncbi:MAG TPA: outer membrane beta-barrel protein [Vicinamibacterales bacterium]|nr:outer membrane beta-barrel protein [Vicinamibacterales bacterium]
MKTTRLFALALLCACAAGVRHASAQTPGERLEAAANLSMLRLSDVSGARAGLGGRLTFDLTRHVALEGELAFYPKDRIAGVLTETAAGSYRVVSERRRTDALFGVKVGARFDRFGVFGKARPGFTRLADRGTACEGPGCAVILMLIAPYQYRTEFAFDFGGGVEVHPTARTVARFEMGDTIIRHRSFAPPCPASECTTHNLSTRLGIGYRF